MIENLLQRASIEVSQNTIRCGIDEKSILITGAAGSIGSEIVKQLINYSPKKLLLLDQSETGLFLLQQELNKLPNVDFPVSICIADITDSVRMNHIFSQFRPDTIFHAAAYKHVPLMEECPYSSIRVNLFGTKLLADLAIRMEVENFIFLSTDKAINPISVMGKTKRLAELYLQTLPFRHSDQTRFIITRFGNVLASSGSVVPLFTKQILANRPISLTHPQVSRYFITLQEAGQLVIQATSIGNNGEILTLTMGAPLLIKELAERLRNQLQPNEKRPILFNYIGLRAGEKLHEELSENGDQELSSPHPHIRRIARNIPSPKEMDKILLQIRGSMLIGDDSKMHAVLNYAWNSFKEVTNVVMPNQ